jgi:hypothetical protein
MMTRQIKNNYKIHYHAKISTQLFEFASQHPLLTLQSQQTQVQLSKGNLNKPKEQFNND